MQYGRGTHQPYVAADALRRAADAAPSKSEIDTFEVSAFRFVPSLAGQMAEAALVISHAGRQPICGHG